MKRLLALCFCLKNTFNMKKHIVWILGTNASGKTSLSRNVHKINNTDTSKYRKILTPGRIGRCGITLFENTAHIGFLEAHAATNGSDMISKKADMRRTIEFALSLNQVKVVVLDALMSTSTWREFLRRDDIILTVVHVFCEEKENVERLRRRRIEKYPDDPDKQIVTDVTAGKVWSKRKYFFNLFDWTMEYSDVGCEIDTTHVPSSDFLFQILLQERVIPIVKM